MENTITTGFRNVDEYLASVADGEHRALLERVRAVIKRTAPNAEETISYQMPAYWYRGMLVYFAAWKNHWGFYPASTTMLKTFKEELAQYKQTKGSIQFPWDKPFPESLIIKLIKKRIEENSAAATLKATETSKQKSDHLLR